MSYGPEHRAAKEKARETLAQKSREREEVRELWDACAEDGGHVFIHKMGLSRPSLRCAGCNMPRVGP